MVLSIIFLAIVASVSAKPLIGRNEGVLESLLRRDPNSCSELPKQSCKDADTTGTCCFEARGGLLMQTQFWDTNLATGPNNIWTIHGLFPDNCDGTFSSNCDPGRAYDDIASHEWAKHGTCMSTFEADCFPGPRGSEAVAFLDTVVSLFKKLPTYDFLKDAGIEPSLTQTYSYTSIQSALSKAAGGADVQVSCKGSQLNSVTYYFNVIGSLVNGQWVSVDANSKGHCPSKVSYKPKSS